MFRFALLLVAGVLSLLPSARAQAAGAKQVAAEVDRRLAEELFTDAVELAPTTDDATFLRRVWLDLVGDIPSPEHVTAFLLDPSEDKRDRVIRDLLASEQFGQNWARYWRDVILYRRIEERAVISSNALVTMLADDLNAGTGWDEVATRFITSTGDVQANGATAIIMAQEGRTEETTAELSRIFLGIQIQCAQCHDHPWDRWQREEFHELAAFFPRTGLRPVNTATRRSYEVIVNDAPNLGRRANSDNANRRGTPEHFMPDLDDPSAEGTKMQPKFFLTGAELPTGTRDAKRRETAAEWMTSSEWFAKAYVNRMWAELVGEGFYEPVDDIGPDRTPNGGAAMEYLSEQFAANGYNPKWLVRVIVSTEAYQRECRPRRLPNAVPFTANVAQPLRGDQLFNSMLTTLELDEETIRNLVSGSSRGYGQQATPRVVFNVAFGFDPSESRETITSSIPQALAMMNTRQINAAASAGSRFRPTSLGKLLDAEPDDQLVTSELFLRTLCREPTEQELAQVHAYGESVGNRKETYEDLLWSLLNSTEYAYRK